MNVDGATVRRLLLLDSFGLRGGGVAVLAAGTMTGALGLALARAGLGQSQLVHGVRPRAVIPRQLLQSFSPTFPRLGHEFRHRHLYRHAEIIPVLHLGMGEGDVRFEGAEVRYAEGEEMTGQWEGCGEMDVGRIESVLLQFLLERGLHFGRSLGKVSVEGVVDLCHGLHAVVEYGIGRFGRAGAECLNGLHDDGTLRFFQ
mmetsp:Transcript_12184/g.35681  ORF Transcript_12184/g.35681 Transcript_12184/m.35681 type:complete len:200 (-) Transcript_12184:300-899(-)